MWYRFDLSSHRIVVYVHAYTSNKKDTHSFWAALLAPPAHAHGPTLALSASTPVITVTHSFLKKKRNKNKKKIHDHALTAAGCPAAGRWRERRLAERSKAAAGQPARPSGQAEAGRAPAARRPQATAARRLAAGGWAAPHQPAVALLHPRPALLLPPQPPLSRRLRLRTTSSKASISKGTPAPPRSPWLLLPPPARQRRRLQRRRRPLRRG